ncbi:F-box domain-containing protein [Mycena kentingensis (nom. inval.)]|nr:F-box domain-containing protein [Mycena kentingensis (nom. inval.)]
MDVVASSLQGDHLHISAPQVAAKTRTFRAELGEIECSLASLRREIQRLECRRKDIKEELASLTYPILDLPAEILCKVFAAAVSQSPAPGIARVMFAISAVCRLWRNVAIADPTLWARIAFVPALREPRMVLDLFIVRSRSLPLRFSLEAETSITPQDWEYIARTSNRWLEASFADIGVPHAALHRELDLPQLQRLSFGVDVLSAGPNARRITFRNAPRLHSVSIYSLHVLDILGVPTHQLRELEIQHPADLGDLLHVLRSAKQLEQLQAADILDVTDTVQPVSLPALHTLSLARDAVMLIYFIVVPALATLHLLDVPDGDDVNLVHLWNAGAKVHTISLSGTKWSDVDIVLGKFPPEMVQHLTVVPYIPDMGSLSVDNPNILANNLGRRLTATALQTLKIVIPPHARINSLACIREFSTAIIARIEDAICHGEDQNESLREVTVDFEAPGVGWRDIENLKFIRDVMDVAVKVPNGLVGTVELL